MKNKIITHFYAKESCKDRMEEVPIYLRIIVNGERAEISTNRRVHPDLWDKTSEKVMLSTDCRRSYVGTWETVEDKLYLTGLEGCP